jgi:hypothetical protein
MAMADFVQRENFIELKPVSEQPGRVQHEHIRPVGEAL